MQRGPQYSGTVHLHTVDELTGRESIEPVAVVANSWMYTWGFITAKCLCQQNASYTLNCVYFEYQNVANPTNVVAIPSFSLKDDRSYFENLASSPDRDYLRVPVRTLSDIDIAAGYEAFFAAGQGNQAWVYAQTEGAVGMTGKPFNDSVNSKIYGVTLVAAPVFADRTQDVLFARSYFTGGQQQVKAPNGQFSIRYPLVFGTPSS